MLITRPLSTTAPIVSEKRTAVVRDTVAPETTDSDAARGSSNNWFKALGLTSSASWAEVEASRSRLVSDLTPGPGASHKRVDLALAMLAEVNEAYASLQKVMAA